MTKSKTTNNKARQLKQHYQTVIIGAGINGCGLLRDLSLHNHDTLLVDAFDFSSQTSASSSKMLHGGIRYLENLDFSLVSEALEEKNLWLKLAPDICYQKPFYLPNYKESKYPLFALGMGMKLYDLLSKFQNSPSSIISKQKVLEKFPQIKQDGLKGAGVYYDAIVDDIKLALNCLWDALSRPNTQAVNYIELIHFEKIKKIYHLTLKDKIEGVTKSIQCDHLVFTTGPFTDQLMNNLNVKHWKPCLIPNKGSHLWLRKHAIKTRYPLVLQNADNRIIFVIPQRDHILVGTTEVLLDQAEFNISISQKETDYILKVLNSYFPSADLSEKDIVSSFAGIRPLITESDELDISKISRKHKVFKPFENCYVLLGGKYTTFRVMVSDVAKEIIQSEGRAYNPNATLNKLQDRSFSSGFLDNKITKEKIDKIMENEKVECFDDLLIRRLSQNSIEHITDQYERNLVESYKKFF